LIWAQSVARQASIWHAISSQTSARASLVIDPSASVILLSSSETSVGIGSTNTASPHSLASLKSSTLFHIFTFTRNVSHTKKRYKLSCSYKVTDVRLWPNHIFVDDFSKNPRYSASGEAFEGAVLFHAKAKITTRTVVSRDFAKATKVDVETAIKAVISGHGLGYEGND